MEKQSNTRLAVGYFIMCQGYVTGIHLVGIPEPADISGRDAYAVCGAALPPYASFHWKTWGVKLGLITCARCQKIALAMTHPIWISQAARQIVEELHLEAHQERRVKSIIKWHALGRLVIYGWQ